MVFKHLIGHLNNLNFLCYRFISVGFILTLQFLKFITLWIGLIKYSVIDSILVTRSDPAIQLLLVTLWRLVVNSLIGVMMGLNYLFNLDGD